MADTTPEGGQRGKTKGGRLKPLMLSLGLAAMGAGAGWYAVSSGTLDELLSGSPGTIQRDVAFVPVDPLTVGVGNGKFLRFAAQLEVRKGHDADVTHAMPRIVDVMNTYLRSVDLVDLESPVALLDIRAQMLRRVDLAVGGDVVTDLLVMEYVVN